MKYVILFFLLTFSIHSKERIVVLDFVHSKNVSREIAISSHNYFISELIKSEQFSIIEKSQLQEILKEAQFQQSGCTDTACEIKIGEMLSADKITSGNIIKKEKKYIITVTIRNVKDKSLEFSETMDLYDLNKLEITMNTLTQRIIPSEDLNLKKRNEKLDKIDEMYRASVWRNIVMPGWGHAYWNDWEHGAKYFYTYTSTITICAILSIPQSQLVHKIENEKDRNEYEYFYTIYTGNLAANNPLLIDYFITQLESRKNDKNKLSYIYGANAFSAAIAGLTLFFALVDNRTLREIKEKEVFSFSVKPESAPALRQTYSYPQKGTHLEFTYTMRF